MTEQNSLVVVTTFYKFTPLKTLTDHRACLIPLCAGLGINGTVILAPEGINGTLAGTRPAIQSVLAWLQDYLCNGNLEHKESFALSNPFRRLKVRLKREIVTMGVPNIDPVHCAGAYVESEGWNELISDPNVIVIDARNDFEVKHGTFAGAVNPATESFGQFPAWFDAHVEEYKGRKIAMFCTGGIRCEKATAYAKSKGFEDVYHLKGGILKYLETVQPSSSRWQGDCFVFDERVALGHGLKIADVPDD
jgi:UPF0176 protein